MTYFALMRGFAQSIPALASRSEAETPCSARGGEIGRIIEPTGREGRCVIGDKKYPSQSVVSGTDVEAIGELVIREEWLISR
jgi:hypothetical protein